MEPLSDTDALTEDDCDSDDDVVKVELRDDDQETEAVPVPLVLSVMLVERLMLAVLLDVCDDERDTVALWDDERDADVDGDEDTLGDIDDEDDTEPVMDNDAEDDKDSLPDSLLDWVDVVEVEVVVLCDKDEL